VSILPTLVRHIYRSGKSDVGGSHGSTDTRANAEDAKAKDWFGIASSSRLFGAGRFEQPEPGRVPIERFSGHPPQDRAGGAAFCCSGTVACRAALRSWTPELIGMPASGFRMRMAARPDFGGSRLISANNSAFFDGIPPYPLAPSPFSEALLFLGFRD